MRSPDLDRFEYQETLVINTRQYMKTFHEFRTETLRLLSDEKQTSYTNHTERSHAGWTQNLYEASDRQGRHVEYEQTRLWRFSFNGVSGEGPTLEDAVADHGLRYEAAMRRLGV